MKINHRLKTMKTLIITLLLRFTFTYFPLVNSVVCLFWAPPIKSQVIKNQLLAIFTFRNCQQNVSEPRKSQRFNPAEPLQIQLNKSNLDLLTLFNIPHSRGTAFALFRIYPIGQHLHRQDLPSR